MERGEFGEDRVREGSRKGNKGRGEEASSSREQKRFGFV